MQKVNVWLISDLVEVNLRKLYFKKEEFNLKK